MRGAEALWCVSSLVLDAFPGCPRRIPRSVTSAAKRQDVLNRSDHSSPMAGEAEVKYLDGDFRVVRPGAFVRCAVTGLAIPLEELRYWSVDLQEPYANPEAVLRRHFPEGERRTTEDTGR